MWCAFFCQSLVEILPFPLVRIVLLKFLYSLLMETIFCMLSKVHALLFLAKLQVFVLGTNSLEDTVLNTNRYRYLLTDFFG